MSEILDVRHLNKRFAGFALQDVSFALPQGFIMGFIGPNGAGKTTTIKMILNMLLRDSGSIHVFGLDNRADEETIKERLGVVMDQAFYVEDWTLDEVERAIAPFYATWQRGRYAQLLQDFGLDRSKKVKELSRGMKMKLMIAAALSHDAQLLILDEPTSGLDPVARDELMEILCAFMADAERGEQRGILFSTHITADLEKIADFITFIREGRIVYTGPKDELMEGFVTVKGGPGEMNAEQQALLIGCRTHATGFEALARTQDMRRLPGDLLFEPATLDEIIIYMTTEGRKEKATSHV
jgi:ABC-2 type transport system ATP-binding protein